MMSDAEEKLKELGIALPEVPKPVANYVPWVRSGSYLYVSGQVPLKDGALLHAGITGVGVSADDAKACARQCAINILAVVQAAVGLSKVRRVVKLVGFVACPASFTAQPGVVNGASDLMAEVFGEAGRHARSAVGVSSLPLNAPVEVEAIFEVA
jgi:enamine deaminase RidA (YjgF/YER057c/UK114 family)